MEMQNRITGDVTVRARSFPQIFIGLHIKEVQRRLRRTNGC